MKTIRHLGQGAFGQVRLCVTGEDNEYVAVKLVDLSCLNKIHRRRALKEAKLLQKLSLHVHVVACRDVMFSEKDVLQIVLEFAPCGDLHQHCEVG
jgi:serine/threonine protein kinase